MLIRCTNCGADIPIGASASEVICAYCDAALFVGRQQGLSHLVMEGYVSAEDAVLRLGRFLSKQEFNSKIQVCNTEMFYFPFWQLQPLTGPKKILHAARTPLAEELNIIPMLDGETGKITPTDVADHLLLEPTILFEEALSLANAGDVQVYSSAESVALIHVPFCKITYSVHDETFAAYVESVSGQVFADELPASPQRQKSIAFAAVSVTALAVVTVQVVFLPGLLQLLSIPTSLLVLYVGITGMLSRMGW